MRLLLKVAGGAALVFVTDGSSSSDLLMSDVGGETTAGTSARSIARTVATFCPSNCFYGMMSDVFSIKYDDLLGESSASG